jgi:hypothetical protein
MSRLSALGRSVRCALLGMCLGAAAGCGWFKASAPDCVPDTNPPCKGPSCEALRSACEKQARLCKRATGECDLEPCVRAAAARLSKSPDSAGKEKTLLACVARKSMCKSIDACFHALEAEEDCSERELQRVTDTAPVLPTRLADSEGRGFAGVVVLPGDDLGCLRCALAPDGCGQMHPGCFSANPAAAGATDTCLDYRVCLRTCDETAGNDAHALSQCAKGACDVPEHTQGKLDFTAYRSCMFERCAACFQPSR